MSDVLQFVQDEPMTAILCSSMFLLGFGLYRLARKNRGQST